MRFEELKEAEGKISGLITLNRIFPREARIKTKYFLLVLLPFVYMVVFYFEEKHTLTADLLAGLFLLLASFWLVIFSIDMFFYSVYFTGQGGSIKEWGLRKPILKMPYSVAEIVSMTSSIDLTAGFIESDTGKDILSRLEISHAEALDFLKEKRSLLHSSGIRFSESVDLVSYAKTIFDADHDFERFLNGRGIGRDDFIATTLWVDQIHEKQKNSRRWWGRDSLGRIRGIGKDWSKGETYLLEQYGNFVAPEDGEVFLKKEIDDLESLLSRNISANVLLISQDQTGAQAVVSGLSKRIKNGSVLPQIEHKKILMLDLDLIDKVSVAPGQFESMIIRLFNQAVSAGDMVLVISNLRKLSALAHKHFADVVKLLEPYISSAGVQIIALTDKANYQTMGKTDQGLIEKFQKVEVGAGDKVGIIRALEDRVYKIENRNKIFFTYQSLKAMVLIANRSDVSTEAKAIEILDSLVPKIIDNNIRRVTAQDVENHTRV